MHALLRFAPIVYYLVSVCWPVTIDRAALPTGNRKRAKKFSKFRFKTPGFGGIFFWLLLSRE
jgi:hypothetical protein